MTEELITGAVEDLRRAIQPLAYPQPHWNAGRPAWADSLYDRMRDALTATSAQSGAPMQASKAPARIDVLCWFTDIDVSVGVWQDGHDTIDRLDRLAHVKWTPDHLRLVKLMTSRCEHWAESAKHMLGDIQSPTPLREKCPQCGAFWVNGDETRTYALKAIMTDVDQFTASCGACKTVWKTETEQASLKRILGA